MFSKIFRPKWQHRKAEVRISAMNELEADDPILLQLAGSDEDPAVRRQALRRIGDLPTLVRLLADERDEGTREAGEKRLKRLLAGEEDDSPAADVRRQCLAELGDEDVLGYVLKHAAEPALRQTALAAVSRPSLLAEAALSDPSGELRLEALGRIERPATLERVAKQARGKDKRVARLARERLEAMRIDAERPERQAEICGAIESLVEQGGVDLIAFARQQKAWQALLPPASDALAQRYHGACEAFSEAQERIKAEAAFSARQRELVEQAEALQRVVEGAQADLPAASERLSGLRESWRKLAEEGGAPQPARAERFNSVLKRVEQRLAEATEARSAEQRLQQIIDSLESLCAREGESNAKALERLESDWRRAGGGGAHAAALRSRFQSLMQRARQRLAEQGQEREQLTGMLAGLLAELDEALEAGQLQQASSSHDRIRDRLARLQVLGGKPASAWHKRWHKSVARLREMRDWRRFGTNQAREALLQQVTALAESELAPQKLGEAVKALRDEWRRLDRKDGPAGEALWQAFDHAAETAYAPCKAHYESLQQERRQHLEERRRFLDELERGLSDTDWQAADWAAVEQRLQQAKKSWSRLGGVEARDWREVNGRYRKLIAQYDEKLAPQREREVQRREGLITRVERLADEADLEKALTEAKSAQAAWRPVVSALPRIERDLWRRFKAACDAVYGRQRAQTQARRDAEQAEREHMDKLCAELEALAAKLSGENITQARADREAIQQAWSEVQSRSRPPKALSQRYEATLKAFVNAERQMVQRQAETEQRLMLEKAALCDRLEARLFGEGEAGVAGEPEAAWEAMPTLRDSALEQMLAARYSRALHADSDTGTALSAAAEENLARAQSLCLQLELLAGVESPVEFADERLAMQVKMLPDAMTGHLAGPGREEAMQRLLDEYLAIGPVRPSAREALTARLQAVLQHTSST